MVLVQALTIHDLETSYLASLPLVFPTPMSVHIRIISAKHKSHSLNKVLCWSSSTYRKMDQILSMDLGVFVIKPFSTSLALSVPLNCHFSHNHTKPCELSHHRYVYCFYARNAVPFLDLLAKSYPPYKIKHHPFLCHSLMSPESFTVVQFRDCTPTVPKAHEVQQERAMSTWSDGNLCYTQF